jgi:hypothetical protein
MVAPGSDFGNCQQLVALAANRLEKGAFIFHPCASRRIATITSRWCLRTQRLRENRVAHSFREDCPNRKDVIRAMIDNWLKESRENRAIDSED